MSDEGDRACPLCAEEMDLTDQQLKPCKCGYEICVWCWHHIMDIAEKDQTQGRCPACRSPYNKEKIVGTTAKCERLVAEMNMEKKTKSQKPKSKISDERKQFGNVRVIQKNLVYIVGLPLTLADEKLLQQRDYFGLYGRVLKMSISRTAAGSIQQFANITCNVYVTYSKEEEAFRCIQSVHGFVLNDRPLKACFGTTKYCHAWLRNMPCSILDCLYLHEIASQEDTFSKDDIASAYSRNRFQQITGAASNMQPRSGNVLPPPADECQISSSTLAGKPTSIRASTNITTSGNGSPPNNSCGRCTALPSAASWGVRASNGNPISGNIVCSTRPSKQKPGTYSASAARSTAVAATFEAPHLHSEMRTKLFGSEENQNKSHKGGQELPKSSKITVNDAAHEAPVDLHSSPSPKDEGRRVSSAPIETTFTDLAGRSCSPCPEIDLNVPAQGNINNISVIGLKNISTLLGVDHSGDDRPNISSGNIANVSVNQGLPQCHPEELIEPSTSIPPVKPIASTDDSLVPKEQFDLKLAFDAGRLSPSESDLQTIGAKSDSQYVISRVREHLLPFEGKRLNGSEFVSSTSFFSAPSPSLHHSNFSTIHSPTQTKPYGSSRLISDPQILDSNIDNGLLRHPSGVSAVLNGFPGDAVNNHVNSGRIFEYANLKIKLVGTSEDESANVKQCVATDTGESNIISNILSLDFDPLEESLTSQNLVKLLAEDGDCDRRLATSNSWKVQKSNKSRFSFARPDEDRDLPTSIEPSFSHIQQVSKESHLRRDRSMNRDFNFDKFDDCNDFSTFNSEEPDSLAGSCSYLSSNKFSGSRSQVPAPPGFSTPHKAPPPGFSLLERGRPNCNTISGNHILEGSSLLRNPCRSPQIENVSNSTDTEFMDPAILAVGVERIPNGFDMRSNFSLQLNTVENDSRFQWLMQRTSPPVQSQRYTGMSNDFDPVNDTHNHLSLRIMEQTLASNISPFSQLSLQQPRTLTVPNCQ